jgi:putative effector of murein hydrolase
VNEERTGKCLRHVEHIRGHFWNRYSVAVNQVMYMFRRSLFVLLYFFFSPLCCPFVFDIRFLIAPLISSSSSYSNQKVSYEKLDQVFLQILLFSTVSFMFLVYNQLSILSVLPLNLSSEVYSAGSIPSNHS